MIYTVTFNPSLDYVVTVPHLEVGAINRTKGEEIFPGGKGINVSWVLRNLGTSTRILGFRAGFTGEEIQHLVEAQGIACDLLPVEKGFSRINVKVRSREETAINGQGPAIGEADLARLLKQLEALEPGDMLVLSGSGPSGCAPTLYGKIARLMQQRDIPCVVDATGELLANVLEAGPFLVKPNKEELEDLLGRKLATEADLVDGARELRKRGARNVLISLGGDGALLVDAFDVVHRHMAPQGTMVNTVGAGDSMVAGFLAGYLKNKDYAEALAWGICAGSATAFSMHLATGEAIEELVKGN